MKKEVGRSGLGAHGLTLKEERFCYFYVKNEVTRGNGTQAYATAYEINLEKLSDEIPLDKGEKVIVRSPRSKAENVCAVEAVRMLRKPKISDLCSKLLNDMLKNEIVDGELAKVIFQDGDLSAKMAGIREYNRLKKRITEKVEVKRPLEDMSDEELMAAIQEATRFLQKK